MLPTHHSMHLGPYAGLSSTWTFFGLGDFRHGDLQHSIAERGSSTSPLMQSKHQLISPSKRSCSRIAGAQFLREFAKFAETWVGLAEENELWLVSNLFRNSIRQKVRAPSSPWVSVRALSPTGSAGQPARRLRVGSTPNLSHIRVHEP